MSIQAISWVLKRPMSSAYLKFTLLCFANYANEYGEAWCSNETLQKVTSMNTKTISKWVKKLEVEGYLVDSGKRRGDTGKIKVYVIANLEIQPKSGVFVNDGNTPNTGMGNTPNIGESPKPPYIDNLKSKPKDKIIIKKSSHKTLAEWEKGIGAQLCVEMISSWIKDARANPDAVRPLIAEFREKVEAQGKTYADFRAAFKVWLRSGWLSKPLMAVQMKAQREVSDDASIADCGITL